MVSLHEWDGNRIIIIISDSNGLQQLSADQPNSYAVKYNDKISYKYNKINVSKYDKETT